jgi:type I restriction enzyme S subunit
MNRYEKYKPSSIEWIGNIPIYWEVKKLSHGFRTIGSGTTPTSGNQEYYSDGEYNWLQTGDLKDNLINSTSKKITKKALDDFSSLKFYPPNSIVIAMYGATIGKTGILKISSTTNQACCVLSEPESFQNKYVFYWFNANKEHVISLSFGGGQPNISQEIIKSLRIPCPSLGEQSAIANYLDEKTSQIDDLISKKQKLIELLKEERTAVINEAVRGDGKNWEKKKLKYLVLKVGSGVTPTGGASVYLQEGIPLLRSQNIYSDGLVLNDVAYISEEIDEQMSNSRIQEGDVLLNITGASIGRSYFVPKNFGRGNVNQHVCIIRPIPSKIKTKFLHLFLISDYGQELIDSCQNGANREGLNFQQIKSFEVPTPETIEQDMIVQMLSTEANRINNTISKIEKEIELMQEYRTSLISEVVTGKIKVPSL